MSKNSADNTRAVHPANLKFGQEREAMDDSLLQKIIKYQFNNPGLLHGAVAKGNKGSQSEMKQLALLGDAF